MKKLFILLLFFTACTGQPETKVSEETSRQQITREETNGAEQLDKPYVILISFDGFRYDYAKRYGATNLLDFKVKAEKMIPSFPSKTFPNHYTIVTGLYPGHNGLVSNEFYDRNLEQVYSTSNREVVEDGAFYYGTPLWVLASEQNMVTASMFWVGSEAPIKGVTPTYSYKYNGNISHEDRVNQVVQWLKLPKDKRPHLITTYFSLTDDLGHKFGPDSPEIEKGVKELDALIGDLTEKINQLDLPVNIIVVSDHGMLETDNSGTIHTEELIPAKMRVTKSFPAMVYSNDSIAVDSLYHKLAEDTTRYSVFLRNNLPSRYHYNSKGSRIGDLIIQPKPPYNFGTKGRKIEKGASTHGFDPATTPQMGAIFYATGPAFKQMDVPPFENVNVYPLIAQVLGLKYDKDSIDGDLKVLEPILK